MHRGFGIRQLRHPRPRSAMSASHRHETSHHVSNAQMPVARRHCLVGCAIRGSRRRFASPLAWGKLATEIRLVRFAKTAAHRARRRARPVVPSLELGALRDLRAPCLPAQVAAGPRRSPPNRDTTIRSRATEVPLSASRKCGCRHPGLWPSELGASKSMVIRQGLLT
jgi:hypothetical protein